MKLIELIRVCDIGYSKEFPESTLLDYVDLEGKPLADPPPGDTLALFIVRELHDTFESDYCDEAQLVAAADTMRRSADDLWNVVEALESHDMPHVPIR